MTTGSVTDGGEADADAMAAADMFTVVARAFEGHRRGPLSQAAERLDRAVRIPYGLPSRSSHSQRLRSIARLIAVMGRPTGDPTLHMVIGLLADVAQLADALGILRQSQQRLHQARAARQAAATLRAVTIPTSPTPSRVGPYPRRPTMPPPRPSRHR